MLPSFAYNRKIYFYRLFCGWKKEAVYHKKHFVFKTTRFVSLRIWKKRNHLMLAYNNIRIFGSTALRHWDKRAFKYCDIAVHVSYVIEKNANSE